MTAIIGPQPVIYKRAKRFLDLPFDTDHRKTVRRGDDNHEVSLAGETGRAKIDAALKETFDEPSIFINEILVENRPDIRGNVTRRHPAGGQFAGGISFLPMQFSPCQVGDDVGRRA